MHLEGTLTSKHTHTHTHIRTYIHGPSCEVKGQALVRWKLSWLISIPVIDGSRCVCVCVLVLANLMFSEVIESNTFEVLVLYRSTFSTGVRCTSASQQLVVVVTAVGVGAGTVQEFFCVLPVYLTGGGASSKTNVCGAH